MFRGASAWAITAFLQRSVMAGRYRHHPTTARAGSAGSAGAVMRMTQFVGASNVANSVSMSVSMRLSMVAGWSFRSRAMASRRIE